jgi:hypothetical protein
MIYCTRINIHFDNNTNCPISKAFNPTKETLELFFRSLSIIKLISKITNWDSLFFVFS